MKTKASEWKWVLQSILETGVFLAILVALGPLTLKLIT